MPSIHTGVLVSMKAIAPGREIANCTDCSGPTRTYCHQLCSSQYIDASFLQTEQAFWARDFASAYLVTSRSGRSLYVDGSGDDGPTVTLREGRRRSPSGSPYVVFSSCCMKLFVKSPWLAWAPGLKHFHARYASISHIPTNPWEKRCCQRSVGRFSS